MKTRKDLHAALCMAQPLLLVVMLEKARIRRCKLIYYKLRADVHVLIRVGVVHISPHVQSQAQVGHEQACAVCFVVLRRL